MRPGDIIFTHRPTLLSSLIAWGQRRRDPKNAQWTHVGICVNEQGQIAEALGKGVVLSDPVAEYTNVKHVCVSIPMDDETRARVVAFATHAVGRRYGKLEIVCLGLFLLTGTAFRFGVDGQMICSALVAGALSRTDAIFPHEPMFMLPADLADYYL